MGVSVTTYVIYGISFDNIILDYDEYEAEFCGSPEAKFRIVSNDNGEGVIGFILASSQAFHDDTIKLIDVGKYFENDLAKLASDINEATGENKTVADIKIYHFTQYS